MGQKVNPIGLRLGIVKEWSSKWYADKKDYAKFLKSDHEIRTYLTKHLSHAALSNIQIERPSSNAVVTLHSARPGIIIGRKGEDIDKLKAKLSKIAGIPVHVNIEEVRKPELDAKLIGDSIAQQLEKRVMFRRAMKRAVTNAMRAGAKGIKVAVSGRLSGAEIARTEWYHEGRVPLHTLRADIDYAISEAMTTYGVIGIKVWVFKGEKLDSQV